MKLWLEIAGLWSAIAVAVAFIHHRRRRLQRIELAAFLEQGRVEAEHHTKFRHDQRLNAIQQRISRELGHKHAFSLKTRRRLRAALNKSGLGSKKDES